MGIFNFGKKEKADKPLNSTFLLQGPGYLRKNLDKLDPDLINKIRIKNASIQWAGQLKSSEGNSYFQIRYFGELLGNATIVSTREGIPQRLMAIDSNGKEEILLFDKAFHGWEGYVVNEHESARNISRSIDLLYQNKKGSNTFRIVFLAYYNEGIKEEILELKTSPDQIQLADGRIVSLQDGFDNAFDAVLIYAIDEEGIISEIINEELS